MSKYFYSYVLYPLFVFVVCWISNVLEIDFDLVSLNRIYLWLIDKVDVIFNSLEDRKLNN